MVVFFLSVALTNMALGYALALYLHPQLSEGGSSSDDFPAVAHTSIVASQTVTEPAAAAVDRDEQTVAPTTVETAESFTSPPSTSAEIAGSTPAPAAPTEQPASIPVVESDLNVAPALEPSAIVTPAAEAAIETNAAVVDASTIPEVATASDSGGDLAGVLQQFQLQVRLYRENLLAIDQSVQASIAQPDAASIERSVREVRTANYEFFERQLASSELVAKSAGTADILASILEATNAHSACISDVDCALIDLDPAVDAKACATSLHGEISRLLEGCAAFVSAVQAMEKDLATADAAPTSAARPATSALPPVSA